MVIRLTYTSNEELSVSHERAYIGWSKQSGTIFTIQGLCDRVLCIGCHLDWMTLKPTQDKIVMNCDAMGRSHTDPDINLSGGGEMLPGCWECLIQASELMAVCEREKRERKM